MKWPRSEVPRHLAGVVDRLLQEFRVVVITGPRQVGKSTLAQAVLRTRPGSYLTLDDPLVRERASEDPVGLVSERSEGVTVIDEVQLVPGLMGALKLAVDRDPRPGAFLVTGSANLLRMREVSESLAGRAAYLELAPLTLAERAGLPAPATIEAAFETRSADEFLGTLGSPPADAAGALREQLCSAIVEGGMPGTLGMGASSRRSWYSAYLATFVERDLWQLGRVDDLVAFRRLFALAQLRTSGLLKRSDLAGATGLDQRTVSRYLDLLEVGYQSRLLTPYAANLGKRLVKMPKLYARDSGMAAHVMRVNSWEDAERAGLAGSLFETWMLGEILTLDSVRMAGTNAYFWRTSAGSEIDVILERGHSIVGLELKSSRSVRWSDTAALRAFRDSEGERFRLGIVAYLGAEPLMLDDRICAVPAWTLVGGIAPATGSGPIEAAVREDAPEGLVLARRSTGVRISDVARLLGVDEATVERWEATGYDDAPISAVRTLAESMGVVIRL